MAIGVALAMLAGAATGMFTGKMRQWFNVPTFITTLALFTALRGFANLITAVSADRSARLVRLSRRGRPAGRAVPGLRVHLGVRLHAVADEIHQLRARVYAVGGNAEAARLSGIDVHSSRRPRSQSPGS